MKHSSRLSPAAAEKLGRLTLSHNTTETDVLERLFEAWASGVPPAVLPSVRLPPAYIPPAEALPDTAFALPVPAEQRTRNGTASRRLFFDLFLVGREVGCSFEVAIYADPSLGRGYVLCTWRSWSAFCRRHGRHPQSVESVVPPLLLHHGGVRGAPLASFSLADLSALVISSRVGPLPPSLLGCLGDLCSVVRGILLIPDLPRAASDVGSAGWLLPRSYTAGWDAGGWTLRDEHGGAWRLDSTRAPT